MDISSPSSWVRQLQSNELGASYISGERCRDDGYSRVMTYFPEDAPLGTPSSTLAPRLFVDGAPPSPILAAPTVKDPLAVVTVVEQKRWIRLL